MYLIKSMHVLSSDSTAITRTGSGHYCCSSIGMSGDPLVSVDLIDEAEPDKEVSMDGNCRLKLQTVIINGNDDDGVSWLARKLVNNKVTLQIINPEAEYDEDDFYFDVKVEDNSVLISLLHAFNMRDAWYHGEYDAK